MAGAGHIGISGIKFDKNKYKVFAFPLCPRFVLKKITFYLVKSVLFNNFLKLARYQTGAVPVTALFSFSSSLHSLHSANEGLVAHCY